MKKKYGLILVNILLIVSMVLSLSGCGQVNVPSTRPTYEMEGDVPSDTPKPGVSGEAHAVNLMAGYASTLTGEGKKIDSAFVASQMELALKLFKSTSEDKSGENLLISPLSIQLALAMNANGARGETREEMERLLGGEFSIEELNEYLISYVNALPSSEKYKLEIANSIWFRNEGFAPNEEFLQTNKNYYDAEIYSAPFDNTTVDEMNEWISKNTDGLIDKAINEISPEAIMYLINAILFDAEWATKYDEYSINEGVFNSVNGEEQKVEMMTSNEHIYIELENAIGFKKNYESGKYSFVALLPEEDVDISDFVGSLDWERLLFALENQSYKHIVAKTPKFSYDFEINLNSILAELGMESAFNSSTADFSGIGGAGGNIYISSVVHKTFIAVDEAGTKAGAVTIVVDSAESAPEMVESIYITLDRPFVYMIVDNATNLPIFMGTLTSINN